MLKERYVYDATVTRVIDGDTVDTLLDLGVDVGVSIRFRLYGINAPEMRGPSSDRGKASKARLEQMLPVGSKVVVLTHKDKQEKYGRYLGEFFPASDIATIGEISINQQMVREGYAVEYMVDFMNEAKNAPPATPATPAVPADPVI